MEAITTLTPEFDLVELPSIASQTYGVRNLRKFPFKKVPINGVHTIADIVKILNCSSRTVSRWIHDYGLPHKIHVGKVYIEGRDLKQFAKHSREMSKYKLEPGEFYCLRCRRGIVPIITPQDIPTTSERYGGGENILLATTHRGTCPDCGATVCRSESRNLCKSELI